MSQSKMPRRSEKSWTTIDFDQCVDLVLVARQRGAFDDVMTKVRRIEEGRQAELAATGLTDGDYRLCDEMRFGGAMCDASKRRLEEVGANSVEADLSGYVVPVASTPPYVVNVAGCSSVTPSGIVLPPGVTSIEDWGSYKVAFGKYEKKKTYAQIFTEEGKEMISYRKYLWSHRNSGSPQLRDLAAYLKAMNYDGETDQMPKIPGTDVARTK